jgi:hypothetical protein
MLSTESTGPYAVSRLRILVRTMRKPGEHAVHGPNPIRDHCLGGAATFRLTCMPTLFQRLEFIAYAMPTATRLIDDVMAIDQIFRARQRFGGYGGHASGCDGAVTVADKARMIDPGHFLA